MELGFASAEFYEDQEELQREKEEEESGKVAGSNSGREGDSSNVDLGEEEGHMIDESRRWKNRGSEEAFLIYRTADPTKAPLFPVSLNFTVKNAFNDLFQT